MKAIDCSVPLNPTTAAAFKTDGIAFAIRYVDNNPASGKRITKEEAQIISNAGLQIISVFEKMGDQADINGAMGKRDGEWALQAAREVGQPDGSCIYFAVDYDAQPSDMDNVAAYIKAAADATPTYSTGVYGSKAVIDEMQKRGACSHHFQTYAWSHGEKNPYIHLYQYQNGVQLHGIEVDLDEAYGNEGAWSLPIIAVPVVKPIDLKPLANILIGICSDLNAAGVFVDESHILANGLRQLSGQAIQN